MIRINLLPFRAARKKENIRRQVSIYALSVVFLLIMMIYFFLQLGSTLNDLKVKEQKLQAELKTYEATIKKIAELERKIKEIRAKLDVIKELERNKTGPVHLLDEITMAVPKDKLWLTSLKESGGTLTLTGTAMDNETVALFMTNLEQSEHVSTVDLQSSRLRNLPEYKLSVSDFVLECRTYAFKEAKAEPPKGKK
ncbi:MAG: PilN domain-containing protein [Deltaproteobacteria bacterium]|nr:PilN domain-containing protein [Deltaproteobacteria bacterium]